MAVDSLDPITGRPIFLDTGAPDIGVDPTAVGVYAAEVGNRIVKANLAALDAYAYKRAGLSGHALDTKTDYVHTGAGWVVSFAQDTGWQTLTLASGWTTYLSETPKYRVKNGILFMSGRIQAGAGPSGVFATLPASARHTTTLEIFRTHYDNGVAGVQVGSDGACAVFDPGTGASRPGIALAAISYPVG